MVDGQPGKFMKVFLYRSLIIKSDRVIRCLNLAQLPKEKSANVELICCNYEGNLESLC